MNRYFGTHTLEGEWHALLPRYLLLGERVRGSRVLDVGCGTGIGSSLLLELGAESVHGVDHRPEVLELAKVKHDKQGLDFHVMFWEELSFPDDHFDMVVCLDPASPITDPNLLVEVRRVLCDGGEYICALERTKVSGLEELLPRYGYTSSADQISIGQSDERVPQVGELSTYFDTIVSLVQRPHISYVFEPESPRGGGDLSDAEEMRRIPDDSGEGGLWHSEESTDEPTTPRESGRWVPVDRHLSSDDAEVAAVEIFFCGDAHLPPPPLREIRLPYYNIVDRLEQLVGDLQVRQRLGGEPSSFDEVLDEPTGDIEDGDHRTTDEFEASSEWDDTPTGVRERPHAPAEPHSPATQAPAGDDPSRVVGLESQLNHLTDLYHQVRSDFDQILHQTKAALSERDEYIDHLVQTVHKWENSANGEGEGDGDDDGAEPVAEDSDFSETAKTGVFKVSELRSDGEAPILDELSEDRPAEAEGLEKESSQPEDLDEDSSDAEGIGDEDSEPEAGDEPSEAGDEPSEADADDEDASEADGDDASSEPVLDDADADADAEADEDEDADADADAEADEADDADDGEDDDASAKETNE